MKKFAIIVAGGTGNRMGTDIPKQFLKLGGRPILMHTMEQFVKYDPEIKIVLVLPQSQLNYWLQLCKTHQFSLNHEILFGGQTRFQSVQNGLKAVTENGIVFIHDGVRPLVSLATLERCFEMADKYGNAIPVLPVTESLRKNDGNRTVSVDRSLFYSVQTPQTFRTEQIMKAYQQDFDPAFTDDASVAEKAGYSITMVDGNPENIKITNPTDLIFAEALLRNIDFLSEK